MFTLKYHINKCKLTLTMQFILFHRDVVVGNNNSQTCLWTNKKKKKLSLFFFVVLLFCSFTSISWRFSKHIHSFTSYVNYNEYKIVTLKKNTVKSNFLSLTGGNMNGICSNKKPGIYVCVYIYISVCYSFIMIFCHHTIDRWRQTWMFQTAILIT